MCAGRRWGMRDLMADWNKWSSAERLLAVVLMLMLIGLPLRVFIAGAPSYADEGRVVPPFVMLHLRGLSRDWESCRDGCWRMRIVGGLEAPAGHIAPSAHPQSLNTPDRLHPPAARS